MTVWHWASFQAYDSHNSIVTSGAAVGTLRASQERALIITLGKGKTQGKLSTTLLFPKEFYYKSIYYLITVSRTANGRTQTKLHISSRSRIFN